MITPLRNGGNGVIGASIAIHDGSFPNFLTRPTRAHARMMAGRETGPRLDLLDFVEGVLRARNCIEWRHGRRIATTRASLYECSLYLSERAFDFDRADRDRRHESLHVDGPGGGCEWYALASWHGRRWIRRPGDVSYHGDGDSLCCAVYGGFGASVAVFGNAGFKGVSCAAVGHFWMFWKPYARGVPKEWDTKRRAGSDHEKPMTLEQLPASCCIYRNGLQHKKSGDSGAGRRRVALGCKLSCNLKK